MADSMQCLGQISPRQVHRGVPVLPTTDHPDLVQSDPQSDSDIDIESVRVSTNKQKKRRRRSKQPISHKNQSNVQVHQDYIIGQVCVQGSGGQSGLKVDRGQLLVDQDSDTYRERDGGGSGQYDRQVDENDHQTVVQVGVLDAERQTDIDRSSGDHRHQMVGVSHVGNVQEVEEEEQATPDTIKTPILTPSRDVQMETALRNLNKVVLKIVRRDQESEESGELTGQINKDENNNPGLSDSDDSDDDQVSECEYDSDPDHGQKSVVDTMIDRLLPSEKIQGESVHGNTTEASSDAINVIDSIPPTFRSWVDEIIRVVPLTPLQHNVNIGSAASPENPPRDVSVPSNAEEMLSVDAPETVNGPDEPDQLNLQGRTRPTIPVAHPTAVIGDWSSIDVLGAEESFFCRFSLLQEVPEQHKSAWATSYSEVLQHWEDASSDEEQDRALKWLGFLPQALLRKPTRGGKAGRAQVAYRFNCLISRDWGSLVELWKTDHDKMRQQRRDRRLRDVNDLDEENKLRKEVLGLMENGQIGRAMDRVTTFGVADSNTPEIRDQLEVKFPPRRHELPRSVKKGSPIESFRDLKSSLLTLSPGTAPGCGGLRNEFLTVLGDKFSAEDLAMLQKFGLAYMSGVLPSWFYRLWLSLQTVALFKNENRQDIRPLGLRNSLIKLFHKEVAQQCKPEIIEFLEPQQLGQSQAGAAKLVHSVRGLLHHRKDFVCIKIDLKNAFNEISRSAIIQTLKSESTLEHLEEFVALVLAPESFLESRGEKWGSTAEGVAQGDPLSSFLFDIGLQPFLVALDSECSGSGGMARAGADDIFAVAPLDVALPAVMRFADRIWEKCGLQLQWTKSDLFSWDSDLPVDAPAGLSLGGTLVNGEFARGIEVYGIPMGTTEYVLYQVQMKADDVVRSAIRTAEVLVCDRQALWTGLRLSIQQRLQYLISLVPPSITEQVAEKVDDDLWNIFEIACGFRVPRKTEEGGLTIHVPIPELNGKTYQEWTVRLPIRLYGWGFRSLASTCGPAYLGALETAVPFMTTKETICPALSEVWGGEESWGHEAPTETRWQTLLESGCPEGIELAHAWDKLQSEARSAANWLDIEIPDIFSTNSEGIGHGSVTGATRGKVVSALEVLRANVLGKALDEVRPKSTRAAWAWRQMDKVSSAWRLALPGHDTQLDNSEFSEAAATALCLPSPACTGRLGEVVRRQIRVDPHGDNIQSSPLPGDHWRTRHNRILRLIHQLCMWSGLQSEMEVYNQFSGLVRQEGLSRIEAAQQRQSLVPDLRITFPVVGGTPRAVLHELKCISASRSRYNPNSQKRAVDIRASKLQGEYVAKAIAADKRYNGVVNGEVGPVQQKLLSLGEIGGLVFGNFGEVSEDTHALISKMANSRSCLSPTFLRRSRLSSEDSALSSVISTIRRKISIIGIKAQAFSLLGRLDSLGPGAKAAAWRRREAAQLDRQWKLEQQAFSISRRQGSNIFRTGFAKLN